MIRRIAALSALALCSLAAAAHAEEDVAVFDNGTLHFEVPAGLLVTTTTVRAPEGPVEVIFVRPADHDATSFVSLTVFGAPLPGDGSPTIVARDVIVDGVRASLHGARVSVSDRPISLAGNPVDGVRLSIDFGDAHATATAGAVADEGGVVVVYYDQRNAADGSAFDALNAVGTTFAFGPAVPTIADDEPETDEETEPTPDPTAPVTE